MIIMVKGIQGRFTNFLISVESGWLLKRPAFAVASSHAVFVARNVEMRRLSSRY